MELVAEVRVAVLVPSMVEVLAGTAGIGDEWQVRIRLQVPVEVFADVE
jgi:hypothetical protein